jgi:hypothetical protein
MSILRETVVAAGVGRVRWKWFRSTEDMYDGRDMWLVSGRQVTDLGLTCDRWRSGQHERNVKEAGVMNLVFV